jgi:DNA-binding response OmpR family regulator
MNYPIDILIVEDNYALRESLADYLQGEGFNIRCADDGDEMNVKLAERVCDVLVLDLNLPKEDGIPIAKRMRSAFPKMGIIILTARIQSVDRTQSYESGADIYLTKPVAPIDLKTVLVNLGRRIEHVKINSPWIFEPRIFA